MNSLRADEDQTRLVAKGTDKRPRTVAFGRGRLRTTGSMPAPADMTMTVNVVDMNSRCCSSRDSQCRGDWQRRSLGPAGAAARSEPPCLCPGPHHRTLSSVLTSLHLGTQATQAVLCHRGQEPPTCCEIASGALVMTSHPIFAPAWIIRLTCPIATAISQAPRFCCAAVDACGANRFESLSHK